MRRRRSAGPSDGDLAAWKVTLAAGLVVDLVVLGLLERLRRTVVEVDQGVDTLWTAGQRLAQNTQVTHVLTSVDARAGELLEELEHHRAPAKETSS